MADITDQHDQTSPTELDDHAGNGTPGDVSRGVKRQRQAAGSDDDDDEKGGRERRKIEIKFIADKSRRHITFSKRKAGIMKKVREDTSREHPGRSRAVAPRVRPQVCSCLWVSRCHADSCTQKTLGL